MLVLAVTRPARRFHLNPAIGLDHSDGLANLRRHRLILTRTSSCQFSTTLAAFPLSSFLLPLSSDSPTTSNE
jgi:hypothetical protein